MAEWHYGQGFREHEARAALNEFDEAARLMPFSHYYRTQPAATAAAMHQIIPPQELEARFLALLMVDPYARDILKSLPFLARQTGDEKVGVWAMMQLQRQMRAAAR